MSRTGVLTGTKGTGGCLGLAGERAVNRSDCRRAQFWGGPSSRVSPHNVVGHKQNATGPAVSIHREAGWEGLRHTGGAHGPPKGSRHPAPVRSSEPQWMLSPELVLNVKSDFWKRERMTGREEAGIPEISLGEGRLGTYQRGHPLKDVDTLPVIDVVRLPTLRGTGGERGRQAPAHRLPPPSCSEQLPWEESWPATSPGDRPGQCPSNSGLTRL